MTKLLNRPFKAFALYSLIILLISIPVYVIVVDYIWVSELDEHNWLTLQHTKQKLESSDFSKDEFQMINRIWGELQPGVSIIQTTENKIKKDSVYEATRPNHFDLNDPEDRFRGIASFLEIDGQHYEIIVETNVEDSDETLLAITIITFFFFIVLIIGFIILNRRIAKNSWKPFYQTLSSLKAFDLAKDQSLALEATDIQEFQELNQSLQTLVKSNVAKYQLQKSFTENASHELQTPIAILKSKLDLLLQEKEVTPQLAEILSSIEAPLARLSRINKNLLLLAKVENRHYSDQESLIVNEYIQSAVTLFEDYAEEKNLTLSVSMGASLMISANAFLLETLIHNLLSNAIRHTSEGGQINIQLKPNEISIYNTGNQALDAQHLFERFSTSTTDKVSSGLGLSIIKEIANSYNWQVNYQFDAGMHSFSMTLS